MAHVVVVEQWVDASISFQSAPDTFAGIPRPGFRKVGWS